MVDDDVEHLVDELGVQFFFVGRLVEVEVAGQNLVRALARQDHLHAHGLDLPRHEEHRGGCTNSRDVVRF